MPMYSRRARLTSALALSAVAAGMLVLGAAPALADPVVLQPGELVVNGGGEQPVSVGWSGSLGRATHGTGGYPPSVIVDSGGATGTTYPGGSALLTGAGGSSTATQTIDLEPSGAAIDNGNVDALLSAYLGGYSSQQDYARLSYDFQDAGGDSLALVEFGPVLRADRGNVSGFVPFAQTQRIPAGTRQVIITFATVRFTAPANDGYADNVSLVLDAPSPVASPDSEATDQGTPVTIDPPANDAPGTGASLVPGSVRLLSGSLEVTSLTTADGSYEVNTTTGVVVFTPDPAFFGVTSPVRYVIADTSGQRAESTITVDVAFVAMPGLALTKSASPADPASYTAGTVITYSFVVTNTGNVRVDGVTVEEDAFSGVGTMSAPTCPTTILDPGEQTVCTATYALTQDDVDNLGISNTATASAVPGGFVTPIHSDPSSFDVPVAPSPAIALTKTASPAGASRAGDVVTYSYLVSNTGNVSVDSVAIEETAFSGTGTLPAASCPSGSLAPGQNLTCSAGYALTQDDVDAGAVSNTAVAAADGGAVMSNSSTADLTIAPEPSFTFVKAASPAHIAAAGETVTYSFTVTNTGNVTLTEVGIDEGTFSGSGALGPISCPMDTVTPAEPLVCTARYAVQAADLIQPMLSNSATATATAAGSPQTSPSSTAITPIRISPDPAPPVDEGGGDDPLSPSPAALAASGAEPSPGPVIAGMLALVLGGAFLVMTRVRRRV